jgi:hypothetical protein
MHPCDILLIMSSKNSINISDYLFEASSNMFLLNPITTLVLLWSSLLNYTTANEGISNLPIAKMMHEHYNTTTTDLLFIAESKL